MEAAYPTHVMPNLPFGVLYVVFGVKYYSEAVLSATSLKRHNHLLHTTCMVLDESLKRHDFSMFDSVYHTFVERFSWQERITCLSRSPYQRTLFLDTDTYVLKPLDEIFPILDSFDIALAANVTADSSTLRGSRRQMPVPEFNCGVILYRMSKRVRRFFDHWKLSIADFHHHDQEAFLNEILRTRIRIFTLPDQFNFWFAAKSLARSCPYILHGRASNLELIEKRLKSIDYPAYSFVRRGKLYIYSYSGRNLPKLLNWAMYAFIKDGF